MQEKDEKRMQRLREKEEKRRKEMEERIRLANKKTYNFKIILIGELLSFINRLNKKYEGFLQAIKMLVKQAQYALILTLKKNKDYDDENAKLQAVFVTNHSTNVDIDEVNFEIWDTAGQEELQPLGSSYYRDTQACLV